MSEPTPGHNVKYLRDRTSAVLITVLSLFAVYFAWYMVSFPSFIAFIVMYLALRLAQFMVEVAYWMWKGLYVDLS